MVKYDDHWLKDHNIDVQVNKANFSWGGLKNEKDDEQEGDKNTSVKKKENSREKEEKSKITAKLSESVLLKNFNIEVFKGEFI